MAITSVIVKCVAVIFDALVNFVAVVMGVLQLPLRTKTNGGFPRLLN